MEVGRPGPDSPVLLTCNFGLTVERVRKALDGLDAYLLVANSRGVNVWCAATGGLLTNHDVVSVLKTSGIAQRVNHRRVVLPQLAATGIESRVVHEKTGWNVLWGPADVEDVPSYLKGERAKSKQMRNVRFGWQKRLEMAAAWAFPMSLLALLGYPLLGAKLVLLVGLIWTMSLLVFLGFPLYRNFLRPGDKAFVRQLSVAVLASSIVLSALACFWTATGVFSWASLGIWGTAVFVVGLVVCVDLLGSTPIYKSGTHEDRRLRISLDRERCIGAGDCEEVCPVDVFDVDRLEHSATMIRIGNCVQCGACIVQCPEDALCFVTPRGERVEPVTIRRFKLNLIGKRLVKNDD
jgi:NAD-dependent dihydropyrimidine dehydrogenase PreA subunit